MLDGAIAQAGVTTGYDPSYVKLDYPGGDVPESTAVPLSRLICVRYKKGHPENETGSGVKFAPESYA